MWVIDMMIGLIPARTGSKRVPNKALTDIGGQPLIKYSIDVAIKSNLKKVIISTDYGKADINPLCQGSHKVEYIKRPSGMCADTAKASEYLQHVIDLKDLCQGDSICLLQPTCPIRTIKDLNNAIALFKSTDKKSLVSAYKLDFLSKLYDSQGVNLKMEKESFSFYRNSSIYIFDVGLFLETGSIFESEPEIFEMEKYKSVDIDFIEDFIHAELILSGGFSHDTMRKG